MTAHLDNNFCGIYVLTVAMCAKILSFFPPNIQLNFCLTEEEQSLLKFNITVDLNKMPHKLLATNDIVLNRKVHFHSSEIFS